MGIPELDPAVAALSSGPLPEQHLLRSPDRLGELAGAFLRREITASQYGDLALAEITRRAVVDPALAEITRRAVVDPALQVDLPEVRPEVVRDVRPQVLAQDFVAGTLSATDFLRLVRDC